ncbi:MAG: hypothetical protein H8E34_02405 [Bacteroidetes bacterium]|nr:hypothetical protein [Bacteroidota bacterium]MBL6944686.1 hypothetical protein [Bacteroidales bacterium]
MMSFTPKKDQDSPVIKLNNAMLDSPSKLTIKIIMSYAAALRVYNTRNLGHTNILLN